MGRWILNFTWAGRTWSFGDEVDVQLRQAHDLFGGGPSARAVTLRLPLHGVDVPALVQAGHPLSAAVGTLYLDGDRVLVGQVVNPSYDADAPVSVTLREESYDDQTTVLDAHAVVDATTWSDADDASVGRSYPEVFGSPGLELGPAVPAHLLDTTASPGTRYVLVAGHWVPATSVRLHCIDDGGAGPAADTYTVLHVEDGRGRLVAVVDLLEGGKSLTSGAATEGQSYFTRWSGQAGLDGRAGQVLLRMMRRSSVRHDAGRFAVAAAWLDRYALGGFIDDPAVSPVDWIADNLLPILPFTLAQDTDGLYPVVWRSDVHPSEAVAELAEGPLCQRVGAIRERGDLLNDVRVQYGYRADTGDYLRIVAVDETSSLYARISQARHRNDAHSGRYSETVTTDIVYDSATAGLIAQDLVRRRALRRRVAQYSLDRERWGSVRGGQFVSIEDTGRSWSGLGAYVTNKVDDGTATVVELTLADDPVRDLHT
ncbi:MAG: hypothetical protein GY925_26420 [Actinomycetia bacterium]|nr:hypothetical protein [Actinomycetes bacterium]